GSFDPYRGGFVSEISGYADEFAVGSTVWVLERLSEEPSNLFETCNHVFSLSYTKKVGGEFCFSLTLERSAQSAVLEWRWSGLVGRGTSPAFSVLRACSPHAWFSCPLPQM